MSQGDFSQTGGWPLPGFATLAGMAPGANAAASISGTGTRAAIARAAQATGVDFSYLLAQAKLESSLDPNARAGTSSAAGLYQFTQGTWAQVLQQHGAEIGLDGAQPGGTLAALRDPGQRARLMALRFDPDASARMAAEMAGDNQAALTASLGRTPRPSELYLAHFLGSDGAVKFLSALGSNPGQSAAALLPKAAGANRSVFFDGSGAPRSVGAVMAMIDQRMAAAMQDSGQSTGSFGDADPAMLAALSPSPTITPEPVAMTEAPGWSGPLGQEFASAQAAAAGGQAGNEGGSNLPRPAASMADTLHATFGLGGDAQASGAAPEFVRSAYGRLRALGF